MADERARGIDISSWQGEPDWDQVIKAGLAFAFIKATEGTGYLSPTLASQWAGAGRIGLLRGPYHYLRGNMDPVAQADYFMSKAPRGELPPVVDFEDIRALQMSNLSGADIFENLRGTLARIEQAWGCLAIVYSGQWYLNACLAESPSYDAKWLARFPLWIAHHTKNPAVQPLRPAWWNWLFYQYGIGRVVGINADVDLNVFAGTVAELRTWAGVEAVELSDGEKLKRLWEAHPELA